MTYTTDISADRQRWERQAVELAHSPLVPSSANLSQILSRGAGRVAVSLRANRIGADKMSETQARMPALFIESMAQTRYSDALERLSALPDDWDGMGAPRVSVPGLKYCRQFLDAIAQQLPTSVRIMPNPLGGVKVEMQKGSARIGIDFGDACLSYYIEVQGGVSYYSDFISYIDQTAIADWPGLNILIAHFNGHKRKLVCYRIAI